MGGGSSRSSRPSYNHAADQERTRRAQIELDAQREKNRRAQIQAENERRVAEMNAKYELQKKQVEAQREAERLKHQKEMENLKNLAAKQDKESKIKQKNEAISRCTQKIQQCKTKITNNTSQLQNIVKINAENEQKLIVVNEKIDGFDAFKLKELTKLATEIELSKAKDAFEACENEINEVINKTSVEESNIGKFLQLTQGLLSATLANQEEANKLDAALSTFGDIISREADNKISVQRYFETKSLRRLIPILETEDLCFMDDLICEEQDEYDEIVDLIQTGIKEQHEKWEQEQKENENSQSKSEEPKPKLSIKEKNAIKKICLKSETWKQEQETKIAITKDSLTEIAPLLGKFFDTIHGTMRQTQEILSYNTKLNDDQLKAIEYVNNMEKTKSIKLENNDIKEDIKEEEDELNNIKNLQLEKVFNSNNIIDECSSLNKAAIISINVVESMLNEFIGNPEKERALGLAKGIEHSCMEIVRCQGQIRQSIILAQAILQLKPANISDESEKLWNSVNNGIVQIFENALEMSRVSSKYFGFFLKFKQSFQYFLSANKKDASLLVSLQYLSDDIKNFSLFQNEFNKRVQELGDSALSCIQSCVQTSIGAEQFEQRRSQRKALFNDYLTRKNTYDKKEMALDSQYDELLQEIVKLNTQKAAFEFQINSLKQQIQFDKRTVQGFQSTIEQLNKTVI